MSFPRRGNHRFIARRPIFSTLPIPRVPSKLHNLPPSFLMCTFIFNFYSTHNDGDMDDVGTRAYEFLVRFLF